MYLSESCGPGRRPGFPREVKFAAEIAPNRHRAESMDFSNKGLQKEKVQTKGMSETKTGGMR